MKKYDWEPSYGFCGLNTDPIEDLTYALELVRRRICAYNMGIRQGDVSCDCKYGINENDRSMGSEATGCPELRELINRLIHRSETLTDQ